MKAMDRIKQERAPFAEALEAYCAAGMAPYHTPGHKCGRGAPPYMRRLFGDALRRDLGLMYALDNLFQPEGPLREAMELAADLYGAGRTFFSVNGTTACIEAMILGVCRRGDHIIVPREAHRSVMNGLILSGAVPVYMESRFAGREQISLGPDMDSLKAAVRSCPQAKAVLFTYPTYDGVAGRLRDMAEYARAQGLIVLVDEAHGAHLPFHRDLPEPALACGADCAAQSTHKLTGSLTQTSMLHCRRGFPLTETVGAAMALVQSTSPNYWFLASLDCARQQLALYGEELAAKAVKLARAVREEINGIDGLYSFGRGDIMAYGVSGGFDETKLTIDFSGAGLDGMQAEKLLRAEGIEVELTAADHVLALLTFGDDEASAEALCRACRHIAAKAGGRGRGVSAMRERPFPKPCVVVSPQDAWNAEKERIPFGSAVGRIAAETVTFYPPGIPVVAAGEAVTKEAAAYIKDKMEQGYKPNGPSDGTLDTMVVLKGGKG